MSRIGEINQQCNSINSRIVQMDSESRSRFRILDDGQTRVEAKLDAMQEKIAEMLNEALSVESREQVRNQVSC